MTTHGEVLPRARQTGFANADSTTATRVSLPESTSLAGNGDDDLGECRYRCPGNPLECIGIRISDLALFIACRRAKIIRVGIYSDAKCRRLDRTPGLASQTVIEPHIVSDSRIILSETTQMSFDCQRVVRRRLQGGKSEERDHKAASICDSNCSPETIPVRMPRLLWSKRLAL